MSSLRWPGDPKDINPKVVVGQDEPREISFIENPCGDEGVLEYDVNTLEIQPNRWAHGPIKVQTEFVAVDQPYVNTCSQPSATNRGCHSHRGCPYRAFPGIGPFNVILKKKTRSEYVPCYNYFTARRSDGYRAATLSYKSEGWELDTTKTTVKWRSRKYVLDKESGDRKKVDFFVDVEVPDLGPMYDYLKGTPNGHSQEGDPERTEVQGGPEDGSSGQEVHANVGGRGGSNRNGKGSTGLPVQGRVPRDRLETSESESQASEGTGSDQDHRSTRSSRRDLLIRGAKVSSSRVG